MALREKLSLGLRILKSGCLRKKAPVFVQFAITNRCNLSCKYCNIPNRKTNELSTGQIFSIIGNLAKLGTKRIALLGGEPLLRDDVGEIIRYIKNKGIYCGLTTNGYLVKSKLKELEGLDTVAISIDGGKKETDYLRGEGSFEKAIEALSLLRNKRIRLILVATLVKANINSFDSIIAIAKRFSCQALINVAYHSTVNSLNAKEELATNSEYRNLIQKIITAKNNGAPILLSKETYKYILNWEDYSKDKIVGENNIPSDFPKCLAGRLFCYIDADGCIYPCPLTVGETKTLNCIEVGTEKAWLNLSNHNCRACCVACFIEYNSIFSLRPKSILNLIQIP